MNGEVRHKTGDVFLNQAAGKHAAWNHRIIAHAVDEDCQRDGVAGVRYVIITGNEAVFTVAGIDGALKADFDDPAGCRLFFDSCCNA